MLNMFNVFNLEDDMCLFMAYSGTFTNGRFQQ